MHNQVNPADRYAPADFYVMPKKELTVGDLRGKSAQIWKELPVEREMVVTSNGRPIAILAAITEANLEESLSAFRRSRAIDAVVSLQRKSVEKGTNKISLDEINSEIKSVRENRAPVSSSLWLR
jgi:antitoxin (DNA-binding transcriptional repressor) of toxin-antitoxin stability system